MLAPLMDVNALDGTNTDDEGRSILHDAVNAGNVDTVAILIPHVNDVQTYRYEEHSLLDLAILNNCYAVASMLVQSVFEGTVVPTKAFYWQPCTNMWPGVHENELESIGWGASMWCAYTGIELDYMRGLCSVLNEPRWWEPSLDSWAPRSPWPSLLVDELRQLHEFCVTPSGFVPNTAHGVSHVDGVAVADLTYLLAPLQATAVFDSDRQLLLIVDPSMHCVVYGHTRFSLQPHDNRFGPTPHVASLDVAPDQLLPHVSTTHQWLSTPVAFDADRKTATVNSYIGGIPVTHEALYRRLEDLLATAAPMVEHALTKGQTLRPMERVRDPTFSYDLKSRLRAKYKAEHGLADNAVITKKTLKTYKAELVARGVDLDLLGPTLAPALPQQLDGNTIEWGFSAENRERLPSEFQVIVEAQSYVVTPDAPTHEGQPLWQLATGLANDGVVASAVVVIDASNVSLGRMDLRQAFMHVNVRPDANQPGGEVFRNEYKQRTVQQTGHLDLHPGRLAVVPSSVQHRLRPFHAIDPSQPGHLTLLRIHFVHVKFELLSTKYVFPQQQQAFAETIARTRLAALPECLLRHVLNYVGWSYVDAAVTTAAAAASKRERDDSLALLTVDEAPPTKRAAV
ncbi:hypothetical protein ACHHYP_13029 [Achlya hypogyna]|uniref:DUF4246 domain-containing protein n=1 Tax=Achlya hypogyna TaxID=1202772 RepID=A0A1V9YG89_ACHHY|nr:hypothetical protein ACHHYP_13029 [Achlya hypogyna]